MKLRLQRLLTDQKARIQKMHTEILDVVLDDKLFIFNLMVQWKTSAVIHLE